MPPIATSAEAMSQASWKSLARYMASVGESFSCANGSAVLVSDTSPTSTLVKGGTLTPAISAMASADWPTMAEFSAPFFISTLRTASVSFLFRMKPPCLRKRSRTVS